ncbi:hypothetical protein [Paenibacillus harenae]|uniref:Phage gpG-like protein n=1 Tax=Paenibacillus harenae TaxID=306543 RepID=A0ABT9TUI3_PAEHA|nr:hypothetical protein [Paenibacillus harenae]MDQ0061110.1 phage gpG-like protein [Paenibacillus harenae]MDQ0111017.1 phage gpG-like protein [Paenibacillus harenae]
MSSKPYEVARIGEQGDALDAIRQLEQKLSEEYGSTVALVAYAEAKHEEDKPQARE